MLKRADDDNAILTSQWKDLDQDTDNEKHKKNLLENANATWKEFSIQEDFFFQVFSNFLIDEEQTIPQTATIG